MRRWIKRSLIALVVLGLAWGGLIAARRSYIAAQYPYGWSHCCDLGLMMSLDFYADAHDGFYPAGEPTPEASLGLLYPKYERDASILRGKSVPEAVVQAALERGEGLGPDTCGLELCAGPAQGR